MSVPSYSTATFTLNNSKRVGFNLFGIAALISIILSFQASVLAQVPIGTWQTYFNYSSAKDVVIIKDKIYCVTENGFFYYDKSNNESIKLSKIDGLSEIGIVKIAYSANQNTLIAAYQSGNIDLIKLNEQFEPAKISNISLLKESSSIQDSKIVNHIAINDNTAYLAYDFGLVILDIDKEEIKETYQNLGINGASIKIYKTEFSNDSIFLSTSVGIRKAKFAINVNLQFFGNWSSLNTERSTFVSYQNGLIIASETGNVSSYVNGKFSGILILPAKIEVIDRIVGNKYFVITNGTLNILDMDLLTFSKVADSKIKQPKCLRADAQGKYWLADYQNGLLSNLEGNYKSYSPASLDTLYQTRKDSVVVDDGGNTWIRGSGFGGIMVKNTANQQKFITTGTGFGNLPSTNVKTMALDKDGQMWVGTDKGVVVFDSPASVFSGKNFDAYTPVFERRRLLGNETVTSIAIDGGNRKWMGTLNGIFLFNSDGTELVTNFTEINAPLPANNINYITAEPQSGNVFIRTSKGLVSYRGTATESTNSQLDNTVKVFPNPVRPDFEGQIGIEGLVENAFVKITDIVGNLVYETRANGGTAVWNGKTLDGKRAETGVYLIFSANAKGEETLVSRLAVVK
ncbi:two-component regulator propeller domain-containing protein [Arcicella aquatica]|uniref:Two-component regulator propeller domain-containing protein n=1 Tax=Arcicella aquatica TaxID=217141 RepID=A0ABU5QTI4_9BACT|nr:two-component regulator propeller domain-containing protein [Arcicella aquatica]MEA5259969.1 two-component regulator propeller domain-containing protein [Arcicella aquatica]